MSRESVIQLSLIVSVLVVTVLILCIMVSKEPEVKCVVEYQPSVDVNYEYYIVQPEQEEIY